MIVRPELPKHSLDENNTVGRSIKKYLAVATMAASLGVSLGVTVVDALADGPESPPAYSKQGKFKSQTDRSNKIGSQQFKESSQINVKQKVETKTGESQINK